jgi:Right handed beta helix region
MTRFAEVPLAMLLIGLLSACPDDVPPLQEDAGAGQDASPSQCAKGLKPLGPACIPVFKACKDNEVPLLGGSCKQVGAPTTCLAGWTTTKQGWCEPTLPTSACTDTTMEVIGKSTCQSVGQDCGQGTYGSLKTTSQTLFVDATYIGGGSDGSKLKPFTTISAAVQAAPSGAQIAVAAGTYNEDVAIPPQKPLIIEGRCAALVKLVGQASVSDAAALKVGADADGTLLANLSISGPAIGVWVNDAKAELRGLISRGCGGPGIVVNRAQGVTIKGCLVADNHSNGVSIEYATATIEDSTIRGTLAATSTGVAGAGIQVFRELTPASATLRRSVITDNTSKGVVLYGASATLEQSVVRRSRCNSAGQMGNGFQLIRYQGSASALTLRDVLVADNRSTGIAADGSTVTVERSVIRDTTHQEQGQRGGAGILAFHQSKATRAKVTLKDSTIYHNTAGGVVLLGAEGLLERNVILDTRQEVSDNKRGFGLLLEADLQGPASVKVRECVLQGNREAGVNLQASSAVIERTVVRGTRSMAADKSRGVGIHVLRVKGLPAALTLRESLISGNRLVGVDIKSSVAIIDRCVIEGTLPQESNLTFGTGVQVMVQSATSTNKSTLNMLDSLVQGSHGLGLTVIASEATLVRSAVRETKPQHKEKKDGVCIAVAGDPIPSKLTMKQSLVERCYDSGIFIRAAAVTLSGCTIREIYKEVSSSAFGDGVQIGPDEVGASARSSLSFSGGSIARVARAGLAFHGTDGEVKGSTFSGCVTPINLGSGAKPTIGDDNVYTDNDENKVTFSSGLSSAPPPSLPPY